MTADCVGGVWTYALELTRQLAVRNVEVTLVVMGGKPSLDQAHEASLIPNLSLIGTDLRLEWMDDCDEHLKLARELLLDIESEQHPDVVHVNGFAQAALPFSAPVVCVAHSCVSSWWRACRGGDLPPAGRAYERRVSEGIAAADLLVAPTARFLAEVEARHGAPRRSRVIWNGRDPALYRSAEKRSIALAAGRLWDDAKNIALLRDAARDLPYPVAVAGAAAGPDGGAIECAPLIDLGRLAPGELAARMSEAAIFVSPARYEPFGLAVLEAALSGCALVLSGIPTFRELWDGAARFVPTDDPARLREELEALFEQPAAAAALGRAARMRAERYTAERMGRAYHAAYCELIEARTGPSVQTVPLQAIA